MRAELIDAAEVLIVEDDDSARAALGDIFNFEGFRVAYACNGKEALEYLHDSPPPCVILLDLQMPVMDGWQFRREQKKDQKLADIPVIGITAFDATGALDGVAILHKPIDVDNLLVAVRRYC